MYLILLEEDFLFRLPSLLLSLGSGFGFDQINVKRWKDNFFFWVIYNWIGLIWLRLKMNLLITTGYGGLSDW